MATLAAPLQFNQNQALNFRAHVTTPAPTVPTPVAGQLYYDNSTNILYFYNGSAWISSSGGTPADATTSSKGIVQLAGDLAGTAASPQIAAGVITDAEVAAANKDGVAGTASMRTIGTGAQQAMPGNRTLDGVNAPTGPVNINSQRLVSVADPTAAQDAATKAYVDAVAVGLDVKGSVKAATTAAITLSGTQTVDGVALVANDRCLVKNQASAPTNGIYSVQAGAWTRVLDMDVWTEVPSAFCFVEQGTVNADTGWVSTADQGGTLNTTNITWAQFSGAGSITAGAGLTQTGTTLDVIGTANRITVAADSVDISTAYVGQGTITTLGTITTGVWNGTAIPVANGGTGSSTAGAARTALSAAGYYNNAATHGAGTTITITAATHGLRVSRGLLVQIQDNATGNVLLADVTIAANGDVTCSFGVSQSANTILVTIIG